MLLAALGAQGQPEGAAHAVPLSAHELFLCALLGFWWLGRGLQCNCLHTWVHELTKPSYFSTNQNTRDGLISKFFFQ